MPFEHRGKVRSSLLVALCLVAGAGASASEQLPDQQPAATRIDLTRCMSHIERASQAVMMRQPWIDDATKALRCNATNTTHLSDDQREQMATVYELFHLQTEAPSATVHTQIIGEMQKFLRMIR